MLSIAIDRRFDTGSTSYAYIPDGDEVEIKKPVRTCRRQSAEKQAESMAYCNTSIIHHDVFTDSYRYGPRYCRIKGCPICGMERAKKLRRRVEEALSSNSLLLSIMPHEAATQLLHRFSNDKNVRASNYLRIPQQDGTDYIFAVAGMLDQVLLDPKPFTKSDLDSIDWLTVQNVSDDYNSSGDLGDSSTVPIKDPNETGIATVGIWVAPEDKEIAQEAILAATAKTFTFDPHTKEELKECSRRKNSVLLSELDLRNVSYKLFKDMSYGNLSLLDWIGSKYHRLPILIDRGLLTQAQVDSFLLTLDPQRVAEMEQRLVQDPNCIDFYD